MLQKISKFEELVGDIDALWIMLEGALKDWNGSFDIWTTDTHKYLSEGRVQKGFRRFCRVLRTRPEGDARCRACDDEFAKRIADHPKTDQLIYPCHVGLIDTAVPIIVNNEHLATVFFGQARPANDNDDKKHFELVKDIQQELGFEDDLLIKLAKDIPRIMPKEFQKARERINYIVNHIIQISYQKMALEKSLARHDRRKHITSAVQQAAANLAQLSDNVKSFWTKVGTIMADVGNAFDSPCGMLITINPNKRKYYIKIVYGLPVEAFNERPYDFYDPVFEKLQLSDETFIEPLNQFKVPSTISGSIYNASPKIAGQVNRAILSRVQLGEGKLGILLFCFNDQNDQPYRLQDSEIAGIVSQMSTLIGASYQTFDLYRAIAAELSRRVEWMEQVTHQIVAPLNAVRGHTESANNRLERWEQNYSKLSLVLPTSEVEKWKSTFESITWTAVYAARLASNLAWITYPDKEKSEFAFSLADDIVGLLIKSARNFQGMARERGLGSVRVNTENSQLAKLNKELCLNEDSFRQAIENLIDNAVKYSYAKSGSDVIIDGEKQNEFGIIRVSNQGIQLKQDDVARIFRKDFRTNEARDHNAPGTGIGLFVAHDIIAKHGGTLTAQPSEFVSNDHWHTTFTIRLPLRYFCD